MKKILLLFFFLNQLSALAQSVDSVYYIINTNKNYDKDGMWKFEYDAPVMYCILQCPCLKNDERPIFSYKTTEKNKVILSNDKLSLYHLVNLPGLILKAKTALTYEQDKKYVFFFIEPSKKRYIVHNTRLSQTQTAN
ncbi:MULTISPECIES: hypothetical protein [unclassified Mucilaginibacter]|uniref:hypothetical protein n=1 Tax=unclassified Mucilaginibacter TaxID=2617802 RepID=UPI002AC90299|nr:MULTISPECIES: hypothetical protein [unclassified Mucilaginibacter]MEB0261607.1 hypothetical protein [Mucilaginibacter sp. 10I4]MEB0277139.1 hypothetical protein [Mucilaginibacter sp. 10B2]MEB0301415.1 hypothetical protein [Mucilaginibacter sp. 5C4]WPX25239.1 hypothetical protein RHM67_08160 [Mucilaginibacter sp. 5C4]